MKQVSLLFGLLFFSFSLLGQNQNDEALFTISDESIPVSEFLYIYKKNLGENADFSKKSLKEYLDLYMKFKLKVKKAKSMNLDTFSSFKREMKGYREQLAKSYLVDKEVNEKLIKEAYDRMQKDLKVSIILISDNTDESKAESKIKNVYDKLKNGMSFSSLAREYSDDKYSNKIGGNLGWITALLPNGFYDLENVIYRLKKGEYSKPFKTKYGYIIAQLNDERPARGEIEASHILIREKVKGKKIKNVVGKIDSIYNLLESGSNFVQLARKYSMDNKTAMKGGYLGFFGINKYESKFEDVAFSLKQNNEYSKPFKSSIGWHIIKRMSKPGIKSYDKSKRSLSNKINKNERYEIARKSLIKRIKDKAGYTENTQSLNVFIDLVDKSFYTFKWKAPKYIDGLVSSIGDDKYYLKDFVNYCKKNQRTRLKFSKKSPLDVSIKSMFADFINDNCIRYEEKHLEEKYPDFKFLMKEYTEGNLLFEVMEKEVWNKASKDTTGLKEFYSNNRQKYKWNRRAELFEYTIHSDNEKLIKKILKYSKKKSHKKLIKKFNKKESVITFTINKFEENDKELEGIAFKKGARTEPYFDKAKKIVTFKKINDILPETLKTIDDAKGYIIADYQEYLEERWIKSLEKEFPVNLNEEAFNKIVK